MSEREYVRIAHPTPKTVRLTLKSRDINRPVSVVISLDNWLDLLQEDSKQIVASMAAAVAEKNPGLIQ